MVLSVGTADNKNLEALIEALKGISCRLMIIGRLSIKQKELLSLNGIAYENRFDLSREEIYRCYLQADLLCFVSTYEGFGMPIIEAQAVGCPVITSNLEPMPEIAGDAALFVDPFNIAEIRNAVITLLSDGKLRKALTHKGYRNIQRFKPDIIAQDYYILYKDVFSGQIKSSSS